MGLAKKTADAFLRAFIQLFLRASRTVSRRTIPRRLSLPSFGRGRCFARERLRQAGRAARRRMPGRKIGRELDRYYGQIVKMYGDGGLQKSAVCQLEATTLANLKDEVDSVDELIENIVPLPSTARRRMSVLLLRLAAPMQSWARKAASPIGTRPGTIAVRGNRFIVCRDWSASRATTRRLRLGQNKNGRPC